MTLNINVARIIEFTWIAVVLAGSITNGAIEQVVKSHLESARLADSEASDRYFVISGH